MATIGATLAVTEKATKFVFSDITEYTTDQVTTYTVAITPYGGTTTTIDLIALAEWNTTSLRTVEVVPADIGLASFTDGVYLVAINMLDEDDVTTLKQLHTLVIQEATDCIHPKVAKLTVTDCGCDKSKKTETDELFQMYMLIQSAKFSLDCAKYAEADAKIKALAKYCDECDCGC
jgi:hypothetical protein